MRRVYQWILIFCLFLGWAGIFPVKADSSVPAMTVNGETENIIVNFNESPRIHVRVPAEATALIVEAERIDSLDGSDANPEDDPQEWGEWFDRYRLRPVVEVERCFINKGVWLVTARYTTEDYEDGNGLDTISQWTTLAAINVTVRNWQGQMQAPVVSLSAASVEQGEWIWATVSNFQQKNEWYWYDLARMDDESGEWGEWFRNLEVTVKEGISSRFAVPTLDLLPGTYRLWIRTEAVGYEDNGTFKTFIVTEADSHPDGITLSSASVPANVPVEMNLFAAGADRLEVTVTSDEDPYWRNDPFCLDGDAGTWTTEFDRPGAYHLSLTAYEGEERWLAGTAVLTVTASEYLIDPVYLDFPGVLSEGEPLSGTLVLDDRTERYNILLDYCPDDGDWISLYDCYRQKVSNTTEAFSLTSWLFTRDGRYRLHIHTYGAGLGSSYNEYWFVRQASSDSSAVTLKINNSTDDITIDAREEVHIGITAPQATAARVLIGDYWEYRGGQDQFEFDYQFGGGDFAVTAQITTAEPVWQEEYFDWGSFHWEDLEWGPYSNAVKVHARQENGRLDDPQITLESDTVARGEWLTGSVAGQNRGEWNWAEVQLLMRNEYGDVFSRNLIEVDLNQQNEFSVPTVSLEPGTYYLMVHSSAVGWKDSERSVPFTVTDSSTSLPEAALYFPVDTILTSQDLRFYAYAPGADYMAVDVAWEGNPGWSNHFENGGEMNSWNWSSSDSGTHIFTLEAWQGGESLGRTSFVLTVDAPYGMITEPAVQGITATMTTDEAVNGFFTPDENASNYGVKLFYCPEGREWENLYDNWRHLGQANATVLAFAPEFFSRPGIYRLEIHSTAVGYNGEHYYRQILVTEPDIEESLVLTVNNGSDDEIYLHQNLPVTVTAPSDVTAVRLWSSSNDWWDYRANVDGNLEWYWGFHNGGPETLVAQGTTDPSVTAWLADPEHDGMWDFDWNSVDWTICSEPVTVNVIKYGDLAAPEVTFPNGTTVARGEILEFTLEPVENAYTYGVQIRQENGWNWLIDVDYPVTETTVIRISTDVLPAGNYLLNIDPRRFGWHGHSIEYPVTVTEGTPSYTTLNLPSGLRIIEEEAFEGIAAEKIIVPSGVTAIGSRAFNDCPNLKELVLPPGITSLAEDALGTTGPVYIYGQAGGYQEAYAQAVANLIFIAVD